MIEPSFTPRVRGQNGRTPRGEDVIACPSCGKSDYAARASTIARSGRGRFVLEDGSAAVFETELAAMLAEPRRPENLPMSTMAIAIAVGWALLLLDLAIVEALRVQEWVDVPNAALSTARWLGIAWFGFLIPGLALVRYFARRESVSRELPGWREASKRWRQVHYCSRDDIVYVPGEDGAHDPEHMSLLLRPVTVVPISHAALPSVVEEVE